MRRLLLVLLMAAGSFAIGVSAADAFANCAANGQGVIGVGKVDGGVGAEGSCGAPPSPTPITPIGAGTELPIVRTLDCGPASTSGSGESADTQGCGFAKNTCALAAGTTAPPDSVIVLTQQFVGGQWLRTNVDCAAVPGTAGPPPVTAAMVREQVVKLLPPVALAMAPDDSPTLVNIQTIVWAPTPTDRDLGPVTVLGQPVAIRIHFDHATYDYGDHTTATVTTPGTAWTPGACTTAQCPTFHGHTYTTADTTTATATITWTATYTVATGPTQPIPGTLDGPTTTHPVTIVEARSVLVR